LDFLKNENVNFFKKLHKYLEIYNLPGGELGHPSRLLKFEISIPGDYQFNQLFKQSRTS